MSCKLDVAIAEALGYEVRFLDEINLPCYGACKDYWTHSGDERWHRVPTYSTDGNAMLKLIGEIEKRNIVIDEMCRNIETTEYIVYVFDITKGMKGNWTWPYVYANKKMPMAVALAVYHALIGKEWVGVDK